MNRTALLAAYAQFRAYFKIAEPWESIPVFKSAGVIYELLPSTLQLELVVAESVFDRIREQLMRTGNLMADNITSLELRLHTGDGQYLFYRLRKGYARLDNYTYHPDGIYLETFESMVTDLLEEDLVTEADLNHYHTVMLRKGMFYQKLTADIAGARHELFG